MYFSLITENYFTSTTSFTCIDNRELLYSTDEFKPTSSLRPIVWQDQESADTSKIGHIIDSGDLSISKDLAEIIMSFDPYGVEFYPSKLTLKNSEVSERYLLVINNVIDVIDEEESDIEVSPYNGDLIIHDLYISEEKLKNTPFNKRVVFRVKGAETAMFFCEEVFNILNCDSSFKDLRMEKVHTDDLAVDI
ncbi:imm11 family protein [Shewanella algae]|uniref:imm11 family protein n=1 Tax=Shewanella algae TaxID=38313 RepID=UPI0030047488